MAIAAQIFLDDSARLDPLIPSAGVRTSFLRTLSKSFGLATRPASPGHRPHRRLSRQRAAHHTGSSGNVNTSQCNMTQKRLLLQWRDSGHRLVEPHAREIAFSDLQDALETGRENALRILDHLAIDAHGALLQFA